MAKSRVESVQVDPVQLLGVRLLRAGDDDRRVNCAPRAVKHPGSAAVGGGPAESDEEFRSRAIRGGLDELSMPKLLACRSMTRSS